MSELKYYCFRQRKSGGSFVVNDKVSYTVIIQAKNSDDANNKAEEIGIYFNGCYTGYDCSCCGDRWSTAWEEGTKKPRIYNNHPRDHREEWANNGEIYCYVYKANGKIKEYRK
jgi:hypothetical protein